MTCEPLVSIIIPIHNGDKWIDECFESVIKQDILQKEKIEISVYNDVSNDNTRKLLEEWEIKISAITNLSIIINHGTGGNPRGVGYAKNQAIEKSSGRYLCFQDIDDVMLPERITSQLEEAKKHPDAIIGCQVMRIPEGSTARFTDWANNLPQHLLTIQIYTSHGPTVLMPTWFFDRKVFERVGPFSEAGKGTPEDLLFFYCHLESGGIVRRVEKVLLIYRYHQDATTFSVSEETIWNVRVKHFEKWILSKWTTFTIWNAGKQGRRFFRSLNPSNRNKVVQFCDVDAKKIGKFYEPYFKTETTWKRKIPIVHFSKAKPPFVTCVKLNLTNGGFEENLNSLGLIEGRDYYVFS